MVNSLPVILCAFVWNSPVGETRLCLCYLVFFYSKQQQTIYIGKTIWGCDMAQIK